MDMHTLLVLFLAVLLASFLHGISGFAFGIVALMIFPYFFPYTEAIALTSLMMIFVLLYNAWLYRKYIVWKLIPIPILAYTGLNFLSILLLKYVGDNPIWYRLLGIMFLVLAVYMYWGQDKIRIKPTVTNAVLFNAAGGIVNGLFGAGGPIAAIYFLSVCENKEEYLGTTQMLFLFCVLIDQANRILNGMVTPTLALYGVCCLWCILIGLFLGKKMFERISAKTFKLIICAALLIDGLYMLLFR